MQRREAGFTFIEILVVMGIIVTLMGMVAVIVPTVLEKGSQTESQNNVRQMSQLLLNRSMEKRWPPFSGKNFVLSLVADRVVLPDRSENLEIFFSPGDEMFRLDLTDLARYDEISRQALKARNDFHELTSYAGRRNDPADREFMLTPAKLRRIVPIVCDDDEGNVHHPEGLIIAYSDGSARFMEWQDLGMEVPEDLDNPEQFLGDNATVEDLRGMASE